LPVLAVAGATVGGSTNNTTIGWFNLVWNCGLWFGSDEMIHAFQFS
jgi:hypothetical protein